MTRTELLAWLEAQHPAPPPALRAHLAAAVAGAPDDLPRPLPLADALARLARGLLARVIARPGGGRELALDLLAADALVTYAFEAQAEMDVAGLDGLAERVVRETV